MTSEMEPHHSPIFVGGTGRSGTTIMGKFLGSHQKVVVPVHENKLIVEDGGLRSLIDSLATDYEYKSNHNAIQHFINWANILRIYGFRNKPVNLVYRGFNRIIKKATGESIRPGTAARALPFVGFSLVGNGQKYGLKHYDRCISDFLGKVIGETDTQGIVDTEGLKKPIYSSSTNDRMRLLRYAREFIAALNAHAFQGTDASRWCDDTPLNARYAEFLSELYPSGKLIHMMRDPRDVAASFGRRPWVSNDLGLALDRLRRHYAALIAVEERVSVDFFKTVRLEDMTSNFSRQNQKLCDFLQLAPDRFDGSVSFEGSSFGRWRKDFSTKDQQRVADALREACAYYGYA